MASDCGAAILQAEGAIEKYMAQAGPSYTDRASALDALKTEWAWTTEQQRDNDPALIADYIAAVDGGSLRTNRKCAAHRNLSGETW